VAIVANVVVRGTLLSSRDKGVPVKEIHMQGNGKWNWCIVAFALAMAACPPVQAAGRLNIELRQVKPVDRNLIGSDGIIDVVLTNTGDQIIEVLSDDIPRQNKRGMLTGSAFEVLGPDGKKAKYNGILMDYMENVLRTLRLAPGQDEVRRVNIVQNYKVSAGERYVVLLKSIRYLDRPRSAFAETSVSGLVQLMKSTETGPLHMLIDPSLDVERIQARGKYSSMVNPPMACDGNKPALFEAARSLAAQMATEAASHIATSYS